MRGEVTAEAVRPVKMRFEAHRSYREDLPFQVIREWQDGTALVSRNVCLCGRKADADAIAAALNANPPKESP